MRGKNTLVINGKVYDAVTGLPVAAPTPATRAADIVPAVPVAAPMSTNVKPAVRTRAPLHAKQAHHVTKKSATLRRDVLKKPAAKAQVGTARRKPAVGHVARSEAIQRFAPHPQPLKSAAPKSRTPRLDITPVKSQPKPVTTPAIVAQKHALVAKPAAQKSQPQLSSRALKEQLIAERLAKVDTTPAKAPKQRKSLFSKQPRVASLITASFAVMVLGGYLTYLNMPGLSVRVAAAQADVAASFPDYHPDGYRFNGPVAYAPGQVAIEFKANGGTTGYTVTEQKSPWDSQAVYDNIVAKAADDSYITNSQQGLTIYTFKGDAAWVNKGILYTITGDAPLSNEQLLRIAGSL